jgi:steroid delta-isomerase-like uncharacterized protein
MEGKNNVETLRNAHRSVNQNSLQDITKVQADEFTYINHAFGQSYNGIEEHQEFLKMWKDGFSDLQITNPTYLDSGDAVVALVSVNATNDGPLEDLPATGNSINIPACEVVRFNDEGQMISGELFFDRMTLLTQLGHIESPA